MTPSSLLVDETGLDPLVIKWLSHVYETDPSPQPPCSVGRPSDDLLRKLISKHVGKRAPTKRLLIPRSTLCAAAVQLNLVTGEEAELEAPRKRKPITNWNNVVRTTPKRIGPVHDRNEWLDDEELRKLLEDHVGELAPLGMPRSELISMTKYLNLIGGNQSAMKRPEYLSKEVLSKRWDDFYSDTIKSKRPKKPSTRKKLVASLLAIGLVSKSESTAKVVRADKAAMAASDKNSKRITRSATFNVAAKLPWRLLGATQCFRMSKRRIFSRRSSGILLTI